MTMEYNRVAFGSCNNQNLTNPLWDVLTTRNPDAFIWAGDAIYADINIGNDWSTFPPKSIHQSATPSSFVSNYNKQKYNKSYQNFIQTTNVTILGTVDDHDYGMNNGDLTFKYKIESGVSFLDFVDEEKDSLMYIRAKKGFGVYGVKVFDFSKDDGQYLLSDEEAGLDYDLHSDGNSDDENLDENPDENPDENDIDIGQQQYEPKRVAIFLLDARTNKTPWCEGLKGWKPNYDGDFLGERQWEWFEKSIQKSNASVNIIVNGLQVHSYRHPNSNSAELWSHFPKSRQRLYDAILQDGVLAPIIVSGDVHMAQFLRKDCVKTKTSNADFVNEDEARIRPLVEFTSSGMTHSWGSCFASTERFHTTWMYYPFHFLSTTMMTLAHFIFPMPDLMVSEKSNVHVQKNSNGVNENVNENLYENGGAENAKKGQQYSIEKNFGEFEFDWKARVVRVRAIGQDVNAPPLLSASYSFDQLSGNKVMPGNIADRETSMKKGKYLMDGNVVEGEFICMNHRPAASLFHVVSGFVGLTSYLAIILLGPQILVLLLIRKMLKQTRKKSK